MPVRAGFIYASIFLLVRITGFLEGLVRSNLRGLLAAILLTTFFLAGCLTHTSIGHINTDPGRFAGREITISGRVADSFGALGNGVYQVNDGSGSIWVFSQNFGVPGNGNNVKVTGRVEQGFAFGGRSFGVILRQTKSRH